MSSPRAISLRIDPARVPRRSAMTITGQRDGKKALVESPWHHHYRQLCC